MSVNVETVVKHFAAGTLKGRDLVIILWMHEKGPSTPKRLAETLRVSVRTVQRALGRLARTGYARKRSHVDDNFDDEWELVPGTDVSLDRSSSVARSINTGIDPSDIPDSQLPTECEELAVHIVKTLHLHRSLDFIRDALRTVPGMSTAAIMDVVKTCKPYMLLKNDIPNPAIKHPAAYFVASLRRAWDESRRAFQQDDLQELQTEKAKALDEIEKRHTSICTLDGEGAWVRVTVDAPIVDKPASDHVPGLPTDPAPQEVVVLPGGRVALAPQQEDAKRASPPEKPTRDKAVTPEIVAETLRWYRARFAPVVRRGMSARRVVAGAALVAT